MTPPHYPTADPRFNCWANDSGVMALYRRRCRREAEEMTCAAQAARILAPLVAPGETLLDVGCGGGYYYWSLADRGVPAAYHGLDFTPEMIALAREEMCPAAGLPPERFLAGAVEYLDRAFDTILCFNVLTNAPHYALPLEVMLRHARKRLLLRECMGESLVVRYTPDPYLDEGKRHIKVYHNRYPLEEVADFMRSHGFRVSRIVDERSGDGEEMVCDIPHTWRILLAERESAPVNAC